MNVTYTRPLPDYYLYCCFDWSLYEAMSYFAVWQVGDDYRNGVRMVWWRLSSYLRRCRVLLVCRRRSAVVPRRRRRRLLPAGLEDILRPSTTLAQLHKLVADAGFPHVAVRRAARLRRRRWSIVLPGSGDRQRIGGSAYQCSRWRPGCQGRPSRYDAEGQLETRQRPALAYGWSDVHKLHEDGERKWVFAHMRSEL